MLEVVILRVCYGVLTVCVSLLILAAAESLIPSLKEWVEEDDSHKTKPKTPNWRHRVDDALINLKEMELERRWPSDTLEEECDAAYKRHLQRIKRAERDYGFCYSEEQKVAHKRHFEGVKKLKKAQQAPTTLDLIERCEYLGKEFASMQDEFLGLEPLCCKLVSDFVKTTGRDSEYGILEPQCVATAFEAYAKASAGVPKPQKTRSFLFD